MDTIDISSNNASSVVLFLSETYFLVILNNLNIFLVPQCLLFLGYICLSYLFIVFITMLSVSILFVLFMIFAIISSYYCFS